MNLKNETKNLTDNGWEFICSECGINLIDLNEKKCNEDKEYYLESFNCSYCPNCGKKVVD